MALPATGSKAQLGIALLRLVVPQRELGAAIGSTALAVALSSAAGPTIGAVLLSGTSWPWLFALNLHLGGLVLFACRALPDLAGTSRPLDPFSVALNVAVFVPLVLGAEVLVEQPLWAATLLAAAALSLAALILRETPRAAPLIPLDLLRAESFRLSVMASVCCFAGMTMGLLALP